jgi:hypothetical protein
LVKHPSYEPPTSVCLAPEQHFLVRELGYTEATAEEYLIKLVGPRNISTPAERTVSQTAVTEQQRQIAEQFNYGTAECLRGAMTIKVNQGAELKEIMNFAAKTCAGPLLKYLADIGYSYEQRQAYAVRLAMRVAKEVGLGIVDEPPDSAPTSPTLTQPPNNQARSAIENTAPVSLPSQVASFASDTKSAEMQYERGAKDFERGDYAGALDSYRSAANQGFAPAQNRVGYMYQLGKGVDQDFEAAMNWYLRAADQGYAIAQFNVGALFEGGIGVTRSVADAIRWYELAAKQGYEPARTALERLR